MERHTAARDLRRSKAPRPRGPQRSRRGGAKAPRQRGRPVGGRSRSW